MTTNIFQRICLPRPIYHGILSIALLAFASGCGGPTAMQLQQCADARPLAKAARLRAEADKKAETEARAARAAAITREGNREAKAGNLLKAELKYTEALKELERNSAEYNSLFDKIIDLAAAAAGGLDTPAEAIRFLKRGMAMVKTAKQQEEFESAESELNRAVEAAPWWGDAYFNRGLIREKMGNLKEAITDFKIYLKAAPNSRDAEAVGDKIITMEVQVEKLPENIGKSSIKWVKIPGGTFMMGANDGAANAKPAHQVAVSPFEMAKTEVTVEQYKACVDAGVCPTPVTGESCNWGKADRSKFPIDCVYWSQAYTFSEWAGGRLPNEAEWEYAARSAGKDRKYPWGSEKATCDRAIIPGCEGQGLLSSPITGKVTAPVCSRPSGNTAQGLCDMTGNVWEWVQDWYFSSYKGAPDDGSAWECPTGSNRVVRGGEAYGATARFSGSALSLSGFRPVRSGQ
jgi:formylglycine-generating enzyme required for sulfatase activity